MLGNIIVNTISKLSNEITIVFCVSNSFKFFSKTTSTIQWVHYLVVFNGIRFWLIRKRICFISWISAMTTIFFFGSRTKQGCYYKIGTSDHSLLKWLIYVQTHVPSSQLGMSVSQSLRGMFKWGWLYLFFVFPFNSCGLPRDLLLSHQVIYLLLYELFG